MRHTPTIVQSDRYIPKQSRNEPVVINSHMFQDSFQALPGQVNGVGGSATVHAQQALGLGSRGVMVAPSAHLSDSDAFNTCSLPSVAYGFVGNSATNHDEWYEDHHREFLINDLVRGITAANDVLYAHMPISGQIAMEHCRSNPSNPLVYLGHAWEILSSTFFPDRAIKPLRLTTEYSIIDYLATRPGSGFIITNSKWEADAIAHAYSKFPSLDNVKQYMKQTAGLTAPPDSLADSLNKSSAALLKAGVKIHDFNTIRSLCIPNPIGVDTNEYHPNVRQLRREHGRNEFLLNHNIRLGAHVIGGVGRIHPQKDPIASLDVFQRVWERLGRPSDTYLLLAGPGDKNSQNERIGYYAQVVDYMNEKHPEIKPYVRIPGEKVDAKDVNSFLDVRMCTARFETWGLSFQESLCMGVPSVALNNPVYDELYQGTGVVLENDRDRLAESIVELIQNPTRRNEYGNTCRSVGSRFDWDNSVQSLQGLLKQHLQFT